MLQPKESARFRKDLKRVRKRSKDMEKLKAIVRLLSEETPLPPRNKDHVDVPRNSKKAILSLACLWPAEASSRQSSPDDAAELNQPDDG
jgi:hypothetical protein